MTAEIADGADGTDKKNPEEKIPDGKVKLSSGEIIDRTDVCWLLKKDEKEADIFRAIDGTVYMKMPNGSLRRVTYKKNEKRKLK